MIMTENELKMTKEFVALARKKKYREDGIELLLMLSCCDQMIEKVGSSEIAIEKVLKFCKESKTAQECVEKTCDLMGI